MAIIFGKAPGKIILFGEHAVVYRQPAIAMPVTRVNATARVIPNLDSKSGQVRIQAPDIQFDELLSDLEEDHPLRKAVQLSIEELSPRHIPAFTLHITSTIPISGGMGSGAAASVAIIRALSAFFGKPLPASETSALAFEVEKIHHGTPSGIDNTVIAHGKPVFFQHGHPIEFIQNTKPTHWLIADSGEKTPTLETVSDVRKLCEEQPDVFDPIIKEIGQLTNKARHALQDGEVNGLGELMNENHSLLRSLQVSSTKLDELTSAAREAGAYGAKLSGGGRGGSIIVLTNSDKLNTVEKALLDAGATAIITTVLTASEET